MADKKEDVCISKHFTLKGYWFLPDDYAHRVAGILTYKPGEKITLELIGGFTGMDNPFNSLRRMSSIPVIFGITSVGMPVTLFDCNVTYASANSTCPFPMETYHCSVLLYGVFLLNRSESCICESFVEIPAIATFLKERPFEVKYHDDGAIEVKAEPRNIDDCENTVIIDGFSFSLLNRACWNIEHMETAVFKSRPTLAIRADKPYSLDDHLRVSQLFIQFLMISSLYPTSCTRVSLVCKTDENDDGDPIFQTVEVVYAHHNVTTRPKLFECLLDYNTIRSEYDSILHKWFEEDEKIGPIKSHLIEVIIDRTHYTSSQFLLMIQAVEGYYNRYVKDNEELTTILSYLKETFDNVDRIHKMNLDILAIRDSRHYYSHFMPAPKKPRTLYGSELAIATSQLRVLLICCMLCIMGFDNDHINDILNSCQNSISKTL